MLIAFRTQMIIHQKTITPYFARYDIVQSTLAARWTFKLDRYLGTVYQLAGNENDENLWQRMRVIDLPKIEKPQKPRFLIFTSGIAAQHTFLFDTKSGKTWTLITSEFKTKDNKTSEINYWAPFIE